MPFWEPEHSPEYIKLLHDAGIETKSTPKSHMPGFHVYEGISPEDQRKRAAGVGDWEWRERERGLPTTFADKGFHTSVKRSITKPHLIEEQRRAYENLRNIQDTGGVGAARTRAGLGADQLTALQRGVGRTKQFSGAGRSALRGRAALFAGSRDQLGTAEKGAMETTQASARARARYLDALRFSAETMQRERGLRRQEMQNYEDYIHAKRYGDQTRNLQQQAQAIGMGSQMLGTTAQLGAQVAQASQAPVDYSDYNAAAPGGSDWEDSSDRDLKRDVRIVPDRRIDRTLSAMLEPSAPGNFDQTMTQRRRDEMRRGSEAEKRAVQQYEDDFNARQRQIGDEYFADQRLMADELADALKLYQYEYKPGNGLPGGRRLGIMAQDAERGGPLGRSMVVDTPRGKAIDRGQAVGAALGMIGRLSERNDELEGRILRIEGGKRGPLPVPPINRPVPYDMSQLGLPKSAWPPGTFPDDARDDALPTSSTSLPGGGYGNAKNRRIGGRRK